MQGSVTTLRAQVEAARKVRGPPVGVGREDRRTMESSKESPASQRTSGEWTVKYSA